MKTLLLMRHAKSSWDHPNLSDHDRPLNQRGERDAPKMGAWLTEMDVIPEKIICSTAKRARQTVDLLIANCPFEGEIIYTREMYHGDVEDFLYEIGKLPDGLNTVMLVGHNPGMEYALDDFCGAMESMPTAAIAHIQFDVDRWNAIGEDGEGVLANIWRPKEIGE